MLLALGALLTAALVVYLDRKGYRDINGDGISALDAIYYTTVSLSTTGYGDIAPATPSARLVNVLVITPLRVLFLIILVGTTLEVLTERTREQWRLQKWRRRVQSHTVVVGYGTKGRSAVRALISDGTDRQQIVVIDPDAGQVAEANTAGITAIHGDATRREILVMAEVAEASRVIVAAQRDDTAVLVTLTVRQLNPTANVIVAVREGENAPLLTQSGANSVIVSSEAAGRLLGLSATSPAASEVFEDLLVPHNDLEMVERDLLPGEAGRSARESKDLVIAVLRGGKLHRFGTPAAERLETGDRVVAVRHA
ncbi:MAG: potassium channel family protein [Frankiaceae bacterium]|nr:potassium channel family protein [Frankiaceae bacterium]